MLTDNIDMLSWTEYAMTTQSLTNESVDVVVRRATHLLAGLGQEEMERLLKKNNKNE